MEHYYGLTGIIVLILDVWAIVSILNSGLNVGNKVLWVVLILVLPIIGFFAWLLAGPKATSPG